MTFKTANVVCVAVGKNGKAQGDRLIRMGITDSSISDRRNELKLAMESLSIVLAQMCGNKHVVINIGVEMTFLDQT